MQHNVKMHLALFMCASLFICSVQESDSGSYFCRASNVHLQQFLASRRATLTVLGMTSQWTCHMVPLLYLHANFFFCLSWQPRHQSKYGRRCWRWLLVLEWCWSAGFPDILHPPLAGWRGATPNTLGAKLLWGQLMCTHPHTDISKNLYILMNLGPLSTCKVYFRP